MRVLLLCCALAAAGARADTVNGWLALATRTALAEQPAWRTLLHYQKSFAGFAEASSISSAGFFLAPGGREDAQAELAATLRAFFSDPPAQCRFIARRRWLAEQLPGLAGDLPAVECAEYAQWRHDIAARRVVLVFAASYLNSPSSMYGHTFLRFDAGDPATASPLLAYALNFGATIPADENGFLYAWRGLAGGYPGFFGAAPYFEKLREYSRLENRDLWEYTLNFTAEETDRLLEHAWELRETQFDYYFLRGNCSLRLLELLDAARPGMALARRFPRVAIPVDTVRVVRESGLVESVNWRPANRLVLTHKLARLTAGELRLARALADDVTVSGGSDYAALDPAERRAVADAAYGYLRYRAERDPRDEAVARRSYDLLRLVSTGPPPEPPPAPARPAAPEDGHRTTLLAVAPGLQDGRPLVDLELRLSYHDLLDDSAGYPGGASLNMGRFVARIRHGGEIHLQRVDLIEITSLTPRDRFFKPWSWRVDAGWDRQWTGGEDVLTTQVNGGAGVAWALAPSALGFALLTARLEYNDAMARRIDFAGGITAGLRIESRLGRTLLSVERDRFTGGVDRTAYAAGHDVTLGRNLAVRAGFDRRVSDGDHTTEASFSLRYYF